MPKRADLEKILIIGSGPIVIGQACEFDYSGTQAAKALRREGYQVVLVNSNPATIMTDPELADRAYIEPLVPSVMATSSSASGPMPCCPRSGGQTGLNLAVSLAEEGVLEKYGVELIGAKLDDHPARRGPAAVPGGHGPGRAGQSHAAAWLGRGRGPPAGGGAGVPRHHPPVLHPGRQRRRHRPDARRVGQTGRARPAQSPVGADPGRGIGHRLERIRAGGHARPRRQLRRRLLHREPRPDGHPHRRQHHRGPGADADRQGVPAPARPGHGSSRRQMGVETGGVQHPVRRQPRRRAHAW